MNLEQKKARLRELNRIAFLSDQEDKERELLKEEIALEYQDMPEEPKHKEAIKENTKPKEEKRKKKTVFGWIFEKIKEKPVTQEEIDELKKKVVKYRLKADIEKSKAIIRKSKGDSNVTKILFGDGKPSRSRSSKSYDDFGFHESKEKTALRKKTLGY